MSYVPPAIACILISLTSSLRAEVIDSDSNGFTVRHTMSVAAAKAVVYDAAVQKVGGWWSGDHTVSGNASNMSIDARPLGCFCESLGDNGGVVHMIVTFVSPEVMIRFTGGLGPLGLMGVEGNMTWEFAAEGEVTNVTLNYAVGGHLAGGFESVAPAVDDVLVEQMTRLKSFAETEADVN
jgi:hypothetical protein